MSVIVILASSIILTSNQVNLVSAGPFVQTWRGFRNSVLGQDIKIEGSQAEEIYLAEQWDQRKTLQNLLDKLATLTSKAKDTSGKYTLSQKEMSFLNSDNVEFSKVSQELREEEFCAEANICGRAFKNAFFSKRSYNLKKDVPTNTKTTCIRQKIAAKKGEERYETGIRQLVKCTIDYKAGLHHIYLAPSTKYDRQNNLQFFALAERGANSVAPIAYLMNKKEAKQVDQQPDQQPDQQSNPQPTADVKLPASSADKGDNIAERIAQDMRYAAISKASIFNSDVAYAYGTAPPRSPQH